MPSKPNINQIIRKKIKTKFGPQHVAAKELGVDYEMLRRSLKENRYNVAELLRLATGLGLPDTIEELRRTYEFDERKSTRKLVDEGTIISEFSLLHRQVNRLRSSFQGLDYDVRRLYRLMKRGDLLVLVLSDERPVEWEDESLVRDIAQAVWNGAYVCYIFPGAKPLNAIKMTSASAGAFFFESELATFRRMLRDEMMRRWGRQCEKMRVAAVEHQSAAFFAPGHKFSLYRHVDEGGHAYDYALSAYPIAIAAAEPGAAGRRAFPLDAAFAEQLRKFCDHAVSTAITASNAEFDGKLVRTGVSEDDSHNHEAVKDVMDLLRGSFPT